MPAFLRSRKIIGVLVAVIAVHILLGVATFGPSTSARLADVPVGLLDEDGGGLAAELLGAELEVIAWVPIATQDALTEALEDRTVAAGLVIPTGASTALAELTTQPEPVVLDLRVSHGRNPQAAQAVEASIVGLVDALSAELSATTLADLASAEAAIAPGDVPTLAQPLQVRSIPVHAPTSATDAQTPLVLVAMLWIGALIATLVSWLGLHRADTTPHGFLLAQLVVLAVLVVVQPVSIVVVGNGVLGMDIGLSPALFGALALTTALFFLLQSAVLNWLGFGGWPLLVLLWLFSFTLLSVPAEALATGYRVLVASWLPSRFPYEAIQGIVHFAGAGRAGSMLLATAGLTGTALLVLLASHLRLRGRDLSVNPIAARLAAVGAAQPSIPGDAPVEAEAPGHAEAATRG